MVGKTLSHYQVLEEIGRGGVGVVYRALDTTLGREVALKVLGPAALREPEQERRFQQEARAAASLAHPAVSVIYEIDEAEAVEREHQAREHHAEAEHDARRHPQVL